MFLIVTEEAVVKGHFTCMHKPHFGPAWPVGFVTPLGPPDSFLLLSAGLFYVIARSAATWQSVSFSAFGGIFVSFFLNVWYNLSICLEKRKTYGTDERPARKL